jgi:hypothetical protein
VIRAPSWEEVEEQARNPRVSGPTPSLTPPKVHNLDAVRILQGVRVLPWADREYLVPPVPWTQAAELYRVQLRLARLQQEWVKRMGGPDPDPTAVDLAEEEDTLDRQAELIERAIELVGGLIRPRGPLRRLVWRLGWRPNPFRTATVEEVRQLLDFFSASPTVSRVNVSQATTFQRSRRG